MKRPRPQRLLPCWPLTRTLGAAALLLLPSACTGVVGSALGYGDGTGASDDTGPSDQQQPGDSTAPPGDPGPQAGDPTTPPGDPAGSNTLSARYPNDVGLANDPSVLFFDDFEQGWGRWDAPTADTQYLHLETDAALAHGGTRLLRSTVTSAHLDANPYISASPRKALPQRVDTFYWRFYARFKGIAPNPHHWVRVEAGNATYGSSGLANTVPPGDEGFWFDFDVNNDDLFNFYVYWYLMRSGRCNDGTAIPGCDGDQGTTYYYGNVFRPPNQTRFARDAWFCIEMRGQTNPVGTHGGELAFWIDDQLIDEYRLGHPIGTWLRAQFYTGGCSFSSCTPPVPFEGFDFRSSTEVRFKRIFLDAYYQRDTFDSKKAYLEGLGLTVSDEQTIYYDDVVVATQRIGCKVPP